jgi:hypothetical protein
MSSALWLPAIYQKQSLTIAGTIWSVLSALVTITIGMAVFHEKSVNDRADRHSIRPHCYYFAEQIK